MLDEIDASIELFLRGAVPLLGSTEVDVAFAPPDRTWSAKLSRPTLNVFLWDIRRSSSRARSGTEQVERDGQQIRRLVLPTVELRYLITAWTPDHRDERGLLGGVLRAVLSVSAIPEDCLTPALRPLRPPAVMMTRTGDDHIDVFRALDGQLKPSVGVVVVTDVDTELGRPVGERVTEPVSLSMPGRRRVAGEAVGAVGRTVRGPSGMTATVNSSGRFIIWAMPGDELVLEADGRPSVVVPDHGGVRFP